MKKFFKKALSVVTAAALALSLTSGIPIRLPVDLGITASAAADTYDFSTSQSVLTIDSGNKDQYNGATITGTWNWEYESYAAVSDLLIIDGVEVSLTISNLTLTTKLASSDSPSPIELRNGATLNLTVEGNNTLTASYTAAGIHVPEGCTLNITSASTGTLTVNGGGGYGGGAGIGADGNGYIDGYGSTTKTCGTINIAGGTIIATGGAHYIMGTYNLGGAGIGGSSVGTNDVVANTGKITISGGNVTAVGGGQSAGIGGGESGYVESISITGGTVTATAGYGAAIGTGQDASTTMDIACGSSMQISITGGAVTADGNIGYGDVISGNAMTGGSVTIGTNAEVVLTDGHIIDHGDASNYSIIPVSLKVYDGRLTEGDNTITVKASQSGSIIGGAELTLNVSDYYCTTDFNFVVPSANASGETEFTVSGGGFSVTDSATLTTSGVTVTCGQQLYPVTLTFLDDNAFKSDINYNVNDGGLVVTTGDGSTPAEGTIMASLPNTIEYYSKSMGTMVIWLAAGTYSISVQSSNLNNNTPMTGSVTVSGSTTLNLLDNSSAEILGNLDLSYGPIKFYTENGTYKVDYYATSGAAEATTAEVLGFAPFVVTQSGDTTTNTITVTDWGTAVPLDLTINGLNINADDTSSSTVSLTESLIDIKSSTVEMTLTGASTLTSNAVSSNRKVALLGVDSSSELTVTKASDGSSLTATAAGGYGAAIGGYGVNSTSDAKASGTINIKGGTITAVIGDGSNIGTGAAIGGGRRGTDGTVNIFGGEVTATSYGSGAAIGSGWNGAAFTVNICGGEVSATNTYGSTGGGAAIGSAYYGNATVTISDGSITAATDGTYAAAIGSGSNADATVTISGGDITATGSNYTPAIGSGYFDGENTNANITITGGNININGATATIGCGGNSATATVTITGGSVNGKNRTSTTSFTDGNSNEVYLITADLSDTVGDSTAVTDASIDGVTYGFNDAYTNADGKLFLWLPDEAETDGTTAATFGGKDYTGTVEKDNSGVFKAVCEHPESSVTYKAKLTDIGINVIAATCGDCSDEIGSITLNAPTNLTYDGTAKTATITNTIDGASDPTITYCCEGGCVNAKEHTASITVGTATASVKFTINARPLSNVTAVQNGTLTYNGAAQTPEFTIKSDGMSIGNFDYSQITADDYDVEVTPQTDAGDYDVEVTPQTDAGDYTAKITFKGNYTGTIENAAWSIGKATPTADMFTYTAPTNLDYDGQQKTATVEAKTDITGMGAITVEYSETPINAGTYTVSIDVAEGTNYTAVSDLVVGTFTINGIDPTYTAPTAVADLTYTGSAQELISAGSVATGGTMKYSLDGVSYTTTIPAAVNADTYNVYWMVEGDAPNYNDITCDEPISVAIAKADPVLTTTPSAVTGLGYTGQAQALITAGATADGEIQYSVDGTTYTSTVPTGIAVNTYTVYYKIIGDSNHNDKTFDPITVSIGKGTAPTITEPTATAIEYGQALSASTLSDSAWSWVNGTEIPTVMNSGYNAVMTVTDDNNYDYSAVDGYDPAAHTITRTIPVTVSPATPTVVVTATPSTALAGSTITVSATVTNPNNSTLTDTPAPTFTYNIGGVEQPFTGSFTIPEDTAVGTVITITATTAADGNYAAGSGTATVTVTDCTHVGTTTLTWDENAHWYHCSNCNADIDKTTHTGGTADCMNKAVCGTCNQAYGKVDSANHGNNVSTAWTTENGYHWHECNGCGADLDKGACTGGTATCMTAALCETCGIAHGTVDTNNHANNVSTVWSSDSEYHWHECACGADIDKTAHSGGTADCMNKAKCEACGTEHGTVDTSNHANNVSTAWSSDGTNHWHNCACGAKVDTAQCSGGTATCMTAAICDVCRNEHGTTDISNHADVSTAWTSDGTNHWHECACGADIDKGACTGGTATCTNKAVCITCQQAYGEINSNNHADKEAVWSKDGTGHWHACGCGKLDFAAHTSSGEATEDTAETCTICGYVIAPATGHIKHTADTSKWLSDETNHWHKCVGCEEKMDIAVHTFGDWRTETKATTTTEGKKTRTCSTCSYVDEEVIPVIGTVAAPVFNPASTSFNGSVNVTITSATDGATIYYTTNGSTPTTASTKYIGAINITSTTTIKAIAVKDGMADSQVSSATYTKQNTGGNGGGGYIPTPPNPPTPPTPPTPVIPDDDDIVVIDPSDTDDDDTNKSDTDEAEDDDEPQIKGDNGKIGWDEILDELEDADDGDTVIVDMNGTTELPEDILDEIEGQDIDLVLEMDNGFVWTINGEDVTDPQTVDMGVSNGSDIPVKVINNVTGECYYITITLEHDGEFGFKAVLTVEMGKENKGYFANLYYYIEDEKDAEFICSDEIDRKGKADLTFTHASEYIIVVDEYDHGVMEDVSSAAGTVEENDEVPFDDDVNPFTGVTISFAGVILSAAAVVAAKKKKKQ